MAECIHGSRQSWVAPKCARMERKIYHLNKKIQTQQQEIEILKANIEAQKMAMHEWIRENKQLREVLKQGREALEFTLKEGIYKVKLNKAIAAIDAIQEGKS